MSPHVIPSKETPSIVSTAHPSPNDRQNGKMVRLTAFRWQTEILTEFLVVGGAGKWGGGSQWPPFEPTRTMTNHSPLSLSNPRRIPLSA